jgi:hypothetical protein
MKNARRCHVYKKKNGPRAALLFLLFAADASSVRAASAHEGKREIRGAFDADARGTCRKEASAG